VEFRFTALSFAAPEKVRFKTKLDGLDSDWRSVGAVRSVAYEAVPPGRYRFHVMAANNDGVWSQEVASVPVTVLPHFWETGWFRTLLGVAAVTVAAGAGWGVARSRMKKRLARIQLQSARDAERARIAQDLHDDLGASLTEISMLASLAAEEGVNGRAAPAALPEIAEKTHALVGALDEIVWAVNPRHDTVASLADYFAAYAVDFLGKAGMVLRLDVPKQLPDVPLDTEHRHALFLAIREALNNTVKHSRAHAVWFKLAFEGNNLVLTIEDDGVGIPAETREQGEGLRNMRQRLRGLGGECVIEPAGEHGTRVCFRLPLNPQSLRHAGS
jgi:signal transduction histidine kinase